MPNKWLFIVISIGYITETLGSVIKINVDNHSQHLLLHKLPVAEQLPSSLGGF